MRTASSGETDNGLPACDTRRFPSPICESMQYPALRAVPVPTVGFALGQDGTLQASALSPHPSFPDKRAVAPAQSGRARPDPAWWQYSCQDSADRGVATVRPQQIAAIVYVFHNWIAGRDPNREALEFCGKQ